MQNKLYQRLSSAVNARQNCIDADNEFWRNKHEENIETMVKNHMPSGSGIDSGTKIDLERSSAKQLVFNTEYHHMNENGYYDGWTSHCVIVRPCFAGIELSISGRDRNQIKDYLYDVFQCTLEQEITDEQHARDCGIETTTTS